MTHGGIGAALLLIGVSAGLVLAGLWLLIDASKHSRP